MFSWFRGRQAAGSPAGTRLRPRVEALEDRNTPVAFVQNLVGGILQPADLARITLGPGINPYQNVVYTGDLQAAGFFRGGKPSVGFNTGIVLSTGLATSVAAPGLNRTPATVVASTILGTPGDPTLDVLAGGPTVDAAELEFDVTPRYPTLSITYVFASELYNASVGVIPTDAFSIEVDGVRVNLVPGTSTVVSANTVNLGSNASLFINNVTSTRRTTLNGLTVQLTSLITVAPGVSHHIRIAVADGGVGATDTAVFIPAGGIASFHVPVFGPLRFTYNARTGTYDGSVTVNNDSWMFFRGPIFITMQPAPGLTVTNATRTFNGKDLFRVSSVLQSGQTSRILVKVSNPGRVPMGTYFVSALGLGVQNILI